MRQMFQPTRLSEFEIPLNDMLQALQEPIINLRQFMYPLNAIPLIHRLRNSKNALVRRRLECRIQIIHMKVFVFRKTMHSLPDHSQTFLNSIFESTTYCHYFTYGFHGTTKFTVYPAELTQIPTRYLAYHIIQRRLEESGSGLRNGVLEFKQTISEA